jgi:hypothetical protein
MPEGDDFHKYEVVDRTHMVFMHLCEALDDHPMVKCDAELLKKYEAARDAVFELYQEAGRKYL